MRKRDKIMKEMQVALENRSLDTKTDLILLEVLLDIRAMLISSIDPNINLE